MSHLELMEHGLYWAGLLAAVSAALTVCVNWRDAPIHCMGIQTSMHAGSHAGRCGAGPARMAKFKLDKQAQETPGSPGSYREHSPH